ncbi:organic hydroperoxide resistance protein [Saccharopolyspora erythraea]|uniref:organic hydroperoxide resistance protein n=1 Tax=Saccharopolyspora erythraea TaxID=1836 RepID=UPI001BAB331B|nr:organic hydroperoxide resistance protein [Saccharopolyspora erythraea]
MVNVLYTAEATVTGQGRSGHIRSSDGVLDTDLSMPKELGGAGGAGTNPEQLFAAGYAACFHSALHLVAGQAKVSSEGSSVTAHVSIGKDGEGFGLAAELVVDLPGVERERAEDLVAQAHEVCPYSRATRGNIEVSVKVA